MRHTQFFKVLPLVLAISACTGEGPQLVLPESESGTVSTASESLGLEDAVLEDVTIEDTVPEDTAVSPSDSVVVAPMSNTDELTIDEQPANVPSDLPTINADTLATDTDIDEATQTLPEQDLTPSGLVRIPRTDTANAPRIDGALVDYVGGTELLGGEWRFAAQSDASGEASGINSFMFGEAGQNEPESHHQWAAMHDGEYLYLIVVSDDEGKHFQDTNELRKPWRDDSIELFFDGNHSQLTEYDGVDDFHFTVNLFSSEGISNDSDGADPKIMQAASSAALPSDLIFKTGPRNGPESLDESRGRKDIYEFRIKISELNIQLEMPFGFEVQINDDDNGGDRDSKWGWHHPAGDNNSNDLTWQNPSIMGTLVLIQ